MTGEPDGPPPPPPAGTLGNCNQFGDCRCPSCASFVFDSESCEIVWACHGCGTYDPYGVAGFTFTLRRESLVDSDTYDYGPVAPRGRMAARTNTRYILTATSPTCAIPREYTVNTPATCECARGCFPSPPFSTRPVPALVEGARSAATLMLWGFTDKTQDNTDGRGGVTTRRRVTFENVNASHSFKIRTGSLGTYSIPSGGIGTVTIDGCKFHYHNQFGSPVVVDNPTGPDYTVYLYDLGTINTEIWWDWGGANELYARGTFRLRALSTLVTIVPPGTMLDPPVPPAIVETVRLVSDVIDSGTGTVWIPDSYAYSLPGIGLVPAGHPSREVIPPGLAHFRTWGSDYNPPPTSNHPSILPFVLPNASIYYNLTWCDETLVSVAMPFINLTNPSWLPSFTVADANVQWESIDL